MEREIKSEEMSPLMLVLFLGHVKVKLSLRVNQQGIQNTKKKYRVSVPGLRNGERSYTNFLPFSHSLFSSFEVTVSHFE